MEGVKIGGQQKASTPQCCEAGMVGGIDGCELREREEVVMAGGTATVTAENLVVTFVPKELSDRPDCINEKCGNPSTLNAICCNLAVCVRCCAQPKCKEIASARVIKIAKSLYA